MNLWITKWTNSYFWYLLFKVHTTLCPQFNLSNSMITYVRWSSRMSHMSGISISRYIQLWYAIPFVSYCFQLDKIAYIFGTLSPILMGFSAKQSSLIALPSKLKSWKLIGSDIRLISLDCITYVIWSSWISRLSACIIDFKIRAIK